MMKVATTGQRAPAARHCSSGPFRQVFAAALHARQPRPSGRSARACRARAVVVAGSAIEALEDVEKTVEETAKKVVGAATDLIETPEKGSEKKQDLEKVILLQGAPWQGRR